MGTKEKTHKYLAVTKSIRTYIFMYSQKKNLRTVPALMIDETKVVHLKIVLPFVGKSCPAHSQCLCISKHLDSKWNFVALLVELIIFKGMIQRIFNFDEIG